MSHFIRPLARFGCAALALATACSDSVREDSSLVLARGDPDLDPAVVDEDGPGAPVTEGDALARQVAPSSCERLRATCPPDRPVCSIYFDAVREEERHRCIMGGLPRGASCGASAVCGDRLACGAAFPSRFACLPTCVKDADCGRSGMYCHPLPFADGTALGVCGACDPTAAPRAAGDRPGRGDGGLASGGEPAAQPLASAGGCGVGRACRVRGVASVPRCRPVPEVIAPTGGACRGADGCAPGDLCVCGDGGVLGEGCRAGGTCRRACDVRQRGNSCGSAGQCRGVVGTLYAFCDEPTQPVAH